MDLDVLNSHSVASLGCQLEAESVFRICHTVRLILHVLRSKLRLGLEDMYRVLQDLAYMVGLAVSTAISMFAVVHLLLLLPGGAFGFLVAALVVAVAAIGAAVFERAFVWNAWYRRHREPLPEWLNSESALLSGFAPQPLATGVIVGALLALKL